MNPKPKSLIPGEVTKIPAKKAYGGGGQSLPRLGAGGGICKFPSAGRERDCIIYVSMVNPH